MLAVLFATVTIMMNVQPGSLASLALPSLSIQLTIVQLCLTCRRRGMLLVIFRALSAIHPGQRLAQAQAQAANLAEQTLIVTSEVQRCGAVRVTQKGNTRQSRIVTFQGLAPRATTLVHARAQNAKQVRRLQRTPQLHSI